MEIKVIPVIAITIGLGVVVLAVTSKPSNKAGVYLDAPNAPPTVYFNAKEVAETLYVAMNQFGTDEDIIMQTLGEVSEAQFASVVLAFGSRKYNTYTGNQYGLFKYTLKEWLKEELSSNAYLTLKSKFRKHL